MTAPAGTAPAGGGVLQGKTALVTAAASGMGRAGALLLAPDGIRANTICPGLTNTGGMRSAFQDGLIEETLAAFANSVPLGRVAEPEEEAAVALSLASDASKYMTGTVLPVDGGGPGG